MGLYNDHILPHVINLSMRHRELLPYRERVLAQAQGRVLEIGIGSGLNLPLYGSRVDTIVGLMLPHAYWQWRRKRQRCREFR